MGHPRRRAQGGQRTGALPTRVAGPRPAGSSPRFQGQGRPVGLCPASPRWGCFLSLRDLRRQRQRHRRPHARARSSAVPSGPPFASLSTMSSPHPAHRCVWPSGRGTHRAGVGCATREGAAPAGSRRQDRPPRVAPARGLQPGLVAEGTARPSGDLRRLHPRQRRVGPRRGPRCPAAEAGVLRPGGPRSPHGHRLRMSPGFCFVFCSKRMNFHSPFRTSVPSGEASPRKVRACGGKPRGERCEGRPARPFLPLLPRGPARQAGKPRCQRSGASVRGRSHTQRFAARGAFLGLGFWSVFHDSHLSDGPRRRR